MHNEHGQSEIQLLEEAKLKQEVAVIAVLFFVFSGAWFRFGRFPFLEFDNLGICHEMP